MTETADDPRPLDELIPTDERVQLYPDHVEHRVGLRVTDDDWTTIVPDEARELADDIEERFTDELDDPEFDHRELVNDLRRIADEVDP